MNRRSVEPARATAPTNITDQVTAGKKCRCPLRIKAEATRHSLPTTRYTKRMGISLDEVRHVAKLARLEMGEAEIVALQGELNALLGHFQDISAINVAGLLPQPHAVPLQNVWAEDVSQAGLPREAALQNAPAKKAGLFLVPTIIED